MNLKNFARVICFFEDRITSSIPAFLFFNLVVLVFFAVISSIIFAVILLVANLYVIQPILQDSFGSEHLLPSALLAFCWMISRLVINILYVALTDHPSQYLEVRLAEKSSLAQKKALNRSGRAKINRTMAVSANCDK